jgi:uncharacterized protein
MRCEEVGFDCGGARCAAWPYLPDGEVHGLPVVVMAHGLTGTRRDGLGPFAARFAGAGMAASGLEADPVRRARAGSNSSDSM